MKHYRETSNVGRVKYVVSFHDGTTTHADGSPFYGARLFSNKRKKDAFVRQLDAEGYTHGP